MEDEDIKSFISKQEEACLKTFNVNCYVKENYRATLKTIRMSCLSADDILLLIKKVATPKGCTEQGIELLDSVDVDPKKLILILNKIHRKALTFAPSIRSLIEELNLPKLESRSSRKSYIRSNYFTSY